MPLLKPEGFQTLYVLFLLLQEAKKRGINGGNRCWNRRHISFSVLETDCEEVYSEVAETYTVSSAFAPPHQTRESFPREKTEGPTFYQVFLPPAASLHLAVAHRTAAGPAACAATPAGGPCCRRSATIPPTLASRLCCPHPPAAPSTGAPKVEIVMEEDTLLEAIYEDDALDFEDVEMADVDDSQELSEHAEDVTVKAEGDDSIQGKAEDVKMVSRKKRRKKSRKKNKNHKDNNVDINSFVLETSRRLNEKKIHLVREAVNYLGLAAVKDLVSEVVTVQKCGGQMTLDGTRQRTGGGILWNILRLRDRKAYKEIMARGRKFMRQRKQVEVVDKLQKEPVETRHLPDAAAMECLKDSLTSGPVPDEPSKHDSPQNHVSVWQRVRVPVSYSDLVEDGTEEGEVTE